MRHTRHRCRREPVPPAAELLDRRRRPHGRSRRTVERRLPPDRRIAIQNRFRDRHQIIDARIGQAFTTSLVQRKLPAEPKDIPRIDHAAAVHRPHQQHTGGIEFFQGSSRSRLPQGLSRRHDTAGDPGRHSGRCGRHHAGHQLRPLRPTQPRENRRQRHTLHLTGPPACQQGVDVSTDTAKGLPQPTGFLIEQKPMLRRQLRHKPSIELVAVASDPGQQVGQRQAARGGARTVARKTGGHQDHARQHRRRFAPQLRLTLDRPIGRRLDRRLRPRQDAVEGGLLHNHSPIESLPVDAGRIPESKEIVGAAGRRVEEIKCPRITCQFFEQGEIEIGLPQKRFWCLLQDRHGVFHEPAVAAVGGTRATDEERNGSNPFMEIGLGELSVFQHGNRSPADVVIEPADGRLHDARRVVAGRIAGQDGLCRRHQKERAFQGPRWLVLEQIGMEAAIGREQPGEEQVEHRPGLPGIPEGRLGGRQRLEPFSKEGGHPVRSIGPLHDLTCG